MAELLFHMKKGDLYRYGIDPGYTEPLKGVDAELADLNSVIDFKFKHVAHQQRQKIAKQKKKQHKKRKK